MPKLNEKKTHALNNAIASVEMEGFTVSEYEKRLCMDVLTGKLTKEKFITQILERCKA